MIGELFLFERIKAQAPFQNRTVFKFTFTTRNFSINLKVIDTLIKLEENKLRARA